MSAVSVYGLCIARNIYVIGILGSLHCLCRYGYYIINLHCISFHCDVVEAHSMPINELNLLLHKNVGQHVSPLPRGSYILMQSLFSDTGL